MSKNTLRNLIIALFIIILGFIIYLLFFTSTDTDNTPNNNLNGDPFGNFFPDSTNGNSGDITDNGGDFQINNRKNKLRQITESPVSGYRIFEKEIKDSTSTETTLQYVERENGHIFETKTTSTANERVSNTTIPKVYEAIFLNSDSNKILYRLLSENNNSITRTYLAELLYDQEIPVDQNSTTSTEFLKENTLVGNFLSDNIDNLTISPENFIFALITTNTNNSNGFILYPEQEGREADLILNSEISQWTPEWLNEDNISLTTKPSYLADGFAFLLNTTTGDLDKVFGPEIALTTKFSSDLSKMFYSKTEGGILQSGIYNLNTSEEQNAGFATLAEKCVWTKDSVTIYCAIPSNISGDFPDTWYLGMYSFNDSIVSYNTETRQGNVHFTSGEENRFFDVLNPQLSENEDYLLFQNKKDLSLWLLDIK
jgi:hypothetical protein